jgi:hypothetical protein
MNILTPLTITNAMILAGTSIAEPAAGETAWVSAGTYALGDLRIRTTTHKVYSCVQAHSGRSQLPETDSAYWLEKSPTNRWSPFDSYTSTPATATTSLTYVLQPGYFNALAMYGLVGTSAAITVKDAPGGATIYSNTVSLLEDPLGWWEFLFLPTRQISKLILTDIPIRPTAELTIVITGATCAVGMINVGDYKSILGESVWGGTQQGAKAEPVSYSYIKTNADGTTTIVRRNAATSMRASVILPRAAADYALQCVQEVLDVPVSWVATDANGYAGLNVFGLGSGSLSYDTFNTATLDISVKGMI